MSADCDLINAVFMMLIDTRFGTVADWGLGKLLFSKTSDRGVDAFAAFAAFAAFVFYFPLDLSMPILTPAFSPSCLNMIPVQVSP